MKTSTIMGIVEGVLMGTAAILVGVGSGVWQYGLAAFIVLLLVSPRRGTE